MQRVRNQPLACEARCQCQQPSNTEVTDDMKVVSWPILETFTLTRTVSLFWPKQNQVTVTSENTKTHKLSSAAGGNQLHASTQEHESTCVKNTEPMPCDNTPVSFSLKCQDGTSEALLSYNVWWGAPCWFEPPASLCTPLRTNLEWMLVFSTPLLSPDWVKMPLMYHLMDGLQW